MVCFVFVWCVYVHTITALCVMWQWVWEDGREEKDLFPIETFAVL